MEPTLEYMARSLVESGDYRVTSRLEPQGEYHPPDSSPKLVTGDSPGRRHASGSLIDEGETQPSIARSYNVSQA